MTQTVAVSLSLTPPLVQRLDRQQRRFARRFGWLSRSALVRLAVVEWLNRNENDSEEEGGDTSTVDERSGSRVRHEQVAPLQ